VGRWNVQIWNATTGRRLLELGKSRDEFGDDRFSAGLHYSPDGRRIAAVKGDFLRIWSIPATAHLGNSGIAAAGAAKSASGGKTKQTGDPATRSSRPVGR
jgi:hypothetical protein